MIIPVSDIRILIKNSLEYESGKEWIKERKNIRDKWQLNLPKIINQNSSEADIETSFLEFYNSYANLGLFQHLNKKRILNQIQSLKSTIEYLLNEDVHIEKRLNDILNKRGEYYISNFGKGIATTILSDTFPDKYIIWNNKVEMGLQKLELFPEFKRNTSPGKKYKHLMEIILKLKDLLNNVTLPQVDYFLHYISAEEKGFKELTEFKNKYLTSEQKEIIKLYYNVYNSYFSNFEGKDWRSEFEESYKKFNDLLNNPKYINKSTYKLGRNKVIEILYLIRKLSNFSNFEVLTSNLKNPEFNFNLDKFNEILFRLKENVNNFDEFIYNLYELFNRDEEDKKITGIGPQIASQFGCYFDKEKYPLITNIQWETASNIFKIKSKEESFILTPKDGVLQKKYQDFPYQIYYFILIEDYIKKNLNNELNFFDLNKFLWILANNQDNFKNIVLGKEKKYWIFQSNPQNFKFEEAVSILEKDTFTINQYKDEINVGDKVLFWVSGPEAGIISYGEILTFPKVIPPNEQAFNFIIDENLKEKHLRVWVSYNPLKKKILRTEILSFPEEIISEIPILKFANNTNFKINETVWNYFMNMINHGLERKAKKILMFLKKQMSVI